MLRKKSWIVWGVMFAAMAILAFVYYYGITWMDASKEPSSYSVVLYQNTDNEWAALLDGVRQAGEDFRVNVNCITMEPGDTDEDQFDVIRREIKGGADGILLAAQNSLSSNLKIKDLPVPLITVETGIDETYTTNINISADNYKMGQMLGKKILDDMDEKKTSREVTVIKEFLERDSVKQRYEGLMDTLNGAGNQVTVKEIYRKPGDFSLRLFIGTVLGNCGEYIAALDKFCTEEAAAAWEANHAVRAAMGSTLRIYGIGNTAQTINDLDNGRLQALVFQNEFNMGYEGIHALVEKDKKGYYSDQFEIKYKLVTRDTLYESENERLLFPSI